MGRILQTLGLQLPPAETRHTNIETVIWEAQQAAMYGVDDYLNIPAVYSGVSMIADTGAQAPLAAYRYDDDGFTVTVKSPPRVTVSPEPGIPMRDWVAQILWSLHTHGDAYLWLRGHDRDGHPQEAWIVDPADVTINEDSAGLRPIYTWRNRTMSPGFDFLHIRINPRPGELHGLSPLEAGSKALDIAITIERFAQEFWSSGAVPTVLLNYPHELDADEAAALKSAFMQGQSSRSPAVLSGGLTADVTAFSPAEQQYVDLRMFVVVEVARLLKIPAPLLQASLPSGSAIVYQNEGTLTRQFLSAAVTPPLQAIEQAITSVLPRGQFARFNLTDLLRPNISERYAMYETGLASNFLTVEEVRRDENLPPMNPTDTIPAVDETAAEVTP